MSQPSSPVDLVAADYDRAMQLWSTELAKAVRNLAVIPHWLPGEDRFWFREETATGDRCVLVDAATGERHLGFEPPAAASQPVSDVLGGPGGQELFRREHDLWLRQPTGEEHALTDDGVEHAVWGGWPSSDLRAVERSRGVVARPPFGCFWSDDGRHVLVLRLDERQIEPYPYLESVPADGSPRPKVHWVRQRLAGEAARSEPTWQVIATATGTRTTLRLPDASPTLQISASIDGCVFWRADGRHIVVLAGTSSDDHLAVLEFAIATGECRTLHEERGSTWLDLNTFQYNRANVRGLADSDELLWYSQSDGWGHLYVLDLVRGGVVRRLTGGAWAVQDVIAVADGAVFFTACGRESGRHPYYRHLYRVDLTATEPNQGLTLLTPEDADHPMSPGPAAIFAAVLRLGPSTCAVSPSGGFLVDTHSTVQRAPVTVVREARTGALIAEVTRCDDSGLRAIGWPPPEIFSAKAADGITDLWGVVVKPRTFDSARSWPVVERIYGGPQIVAQPRNYAEALTSAFMYGVWPLADLGFVVVVLDGPGTPCRSKTFHDMTYGKEDRWGVAHHRAAIEGAAATRPWMDLSRVGISGHSYGGYATAMAMLLEPGFYRVGVSSAGMYDPAWAQQSTPERHIGRPDFGEGRDVKAMAHEVAVNHWRISPSRLASRLEGRLLLAWGDLDENIQPAALIAFSNALISAGKQFDELCLPGRNHAFVAEAYFQKRMWDYFIEHLQGRRPLRHLKLEQAPGPRILL